jgi:hypothetical protein
LVYDAISSQIIGQPVWFILTSGLDGYATYRAKDLVWCYDRWLIGDISTERHGYLNDMTAEQWALPSRWEFGTSIVYGEGRGMLFRELELVCLTGRVSIEDDPIITTSYSIDGEVWSQEKPVRAGRKGDRVKRIVWFFQGFMENWRIQRFRGTSDAFLTIARLEAQLEPLAV